MPAIFSATYRSDALNAAVADLRAGKPVAIPTETVYGLAADATNGEAVARIYQMKGRPQFNPLICHVDGLVMAQEYGLLNDLAIRLASELWPGPLTIVVPARRGTPLSELVTAGLATVGLRCPKGLARQIISAFGKPLAAPSANRSGRVSPTTAAHVAEEYDDATLTIIDGGPCEVGLESTIVKVLEGRIVLLRHGAITAEEIETVTGIVPDLAQAREGIQAPGMLASHYAPDASVEMNCETCGISDGWLGFGNRMAPQNAALSLNLSPSSNLVEAAANLYGYLKQFDAEGIKRICVSPVPMEGLGIAINDRLSRAAAPREPALAEVSK
jgi:L-threonylcarbamoyladenylate synthase